MSRESGNVAHTFVMRTWLKPAPVPSTVHYTSWTKLVILNFIIQEEHGEHTSVLRLIKNNTCSVKNRHGQHFQQRSLTRSKLRRACRVKFQCYSTTIKLNNCFSVSLPLKFNTLNTLLHEYCRAEKTLVKPLHYIRLYKHCVTIWSNNTIFVDAEKYSGVF